jgi:predicted lipoprotein with Yx(FWY)xxD motif
MKRVTQFAIVALASLTLIGIVSAQQAGGASIQLGDHEEYGSYLTDAEGRTLYLFVNEDLESMDSERMTEGVRSNAVTCVGDCLGAWPAFTAEGEVMAGEGIDEELLYTAEFDGRMHVVYNGWPLFYFVRDEAPGQVAGHEIESFGGTWYLVDAEGNPVSADE